jgi:hypothetical protein
MGLHIALQQLDLLVQIGDGGLEFILIGCQLGLKSTYLLCVVFLHLILHGLKSFSVLTKIFKLLLQLSLNGSLLFVLESELVPIHLKFLAFLLD